MNTSPDEPSPTADQAADFASAAETPTTPSAENHLFQSCYSTGARIMLVPIGIALALSIFTGLVALVCTVRWLAAVREGEYLVEALVATGIAALCTSICVNMIRNWIHPKVWSSALTQDSLFWTGPKNAGTVPLSEISSLLIEGNHWVSVIDKQGKAWSVPMTCLGSLPKFVQILRAHFPEIQVTVTRWGARRTGIFVPRGLPTRSSR